MAPKQGHADACQFAIEAGDSVFAPRMKALLLRRGDRSPAP